MLSLLTLGGLILNKTDFRNHLDRANGSSSLLMILSILGLIPGGYQAYRFIMDTVDDYKISTQNLVGLGDIKIPGLNLVIPEPYASLGLIALALLIPLWIIFSLIPKKVKLSRGIRPGRGLYILSALASLIPILWAAEVPQKLLGGNLGFSMPSTLPEYGLVLLGILGFIASFIAFGHLSRAKKVEEDYDPSLEETSREVIDHDDDILDRDKVSQDTMVVDEKIEDKSNLKDQPLDHQEHRVEAAATAAAVAAQEAETQASTEPADLVQKEDQPLPVEPAAEVPEQITQRRLIAHPDDQTKVIAIYRTLEGDQVIKEWTEILDRKSLKNKKA